MSNAPTPDEAYEAYEREIDLLRSAERTGAPTRDIHSDFFGLPQDEFVAALRELRDEIESRAYLAIVAAAEATVQLDFRARAGARASTLLRATARSWTRAEKRGRRIVLEEILDAWAKLHGARQDAISQFKQLLQHRHWLAHGRYFTNRAGVPVGPAFAVERARALFKALREIDPAFPR
jgi:hypothetical protein